MQQTSAITQNANVGGDIAIHAGNVTHIFGTDNDAQQVTALDDVSIDVSKGELLCLIGPSGCGKSTLLRLMVGLLTPDRGEVRFGDAPIG